MTKQALNLAITTLFLVFCSGVSKAQLTQSIRGLVIDKGTQQTLPGATISVFKGDSLIKGQISDSEGRFIMKGINPGRYQIRCQFMGFRNWQVDFQELTSGKELILQIELVEAMIKGKEVIIEAHRPDYFPDNEFTTLSARSFSVEETQRYAASINDPGRMAMSLPGVQLSGQDNENTLVIRGNTAIGMSWKLEGVEIPNPNHFADKASSGGGLSALSIFVLGHSDFLTSAFPAEYGNAFAGVMDLRFRKGNNEAREHRIQAGMLGLEVATEGPFSIKKKNSSYVINYRYSTLGILNGLGVRVVGPNVDNVFQDLSFNLNFPMGKKHKLSFFGLGGISREQRHAVKDTAQWESFNDTRQYDYNTKLGILGMTHTWLINKRSFLYSVLMVGANEVTWKEDVLSSAGTAFNLKDEKFLNGRYNLMSSFNYKPGPRLGIKIGAQFSLHFYEVFSGRGPRNVLDADIRIIGSGKPISFQPYIQVNQKFGNRWILNYGVHLLYFSKTNSMATEPRAGLKFMINEKNQIGIAGGLHSQILPFTTYETNYLLPTDGSSKPNENLDLFKAWHIGFAYDLFPGGAFHLRLEPYYQYLFNVPVATSAFSTYSLINQNDDFYDGPMSNDGTGENYGIEMTLEKSFSNKLFFILSGSVYESKYGTKYLGEKVTFNTAFASNQNISLTGGKEWVITKQRAFELGGRVIWGGGLRYTPINDTLSALAGRQIDKQDQQFTAQNPDYFRIDFRAAFRKNREKYSWKLALDIQNLTNRINPKRPFYDPWKNEIAFDPMSGLVPVLSYILDF
jgi:CarboxypepD_reg-like domain